MKRWDFVTIAMQGDFGKPRPALIIQSDQFDPLATMTLLLVSSDFVEAPLFRITVKPDNKKGLRKASQIMVDKAMTIRQDMLGAPFGVASDDLMVAVNRALAFFLGIAR